MVNKWRNSGNSDRLYFLGLQNHCQWWLQSWNYRYLLLGRKVITNLDNILKSRDITLPTKVCLVKAMVLPVVVYGCDHKNWCFWTVVLEKTLESPLDCKEIKPGNPKGNQSGIFIGRTDAKAEAPILWPPDAKNWLIWKDPDAGKDWRQEEKGTTENEMVGWHHWLNGHEFEHAPGVGDGQGSVLQSIGLQRVKYDWETELNWTELKLCSTPGDIGGLISEQQRFPSPTQPLSSTLTSASEIPEQIVTRR